jgi:Na+-translocating ferredoxin:NAD+ oxidoreductase RNF subunit RnfB
MVYFLPGANCGGCGFAGCQNFAENVVSGQTSPAGCPVCPDDDFAEIARIMGVDAEKHERMIARVFCQGGEYETARKALYRGIPSCLAATLLSGGDKLCEFGCIGYGDCIKACPFGAMYLSSNGLPVVVDQKCTGCGNCVAACPRGVIELHPESDKLFVLCKNNDAPKDARRTCLKACIGCGICVRAVQEGEIVMTNNLARIDYERYGKDAVLPTEKCAPGCLVVLDRQHLAAKEEVAAA